MQLWATWGMRLVVWMLMAGIIVPAGVAQRVPVSKAVYPQLASSTYFGKTADRVNSLAVGLDGSLYLAGVTIASPGQIDANQWNAGGGKPFVAHVSADGTKLLYFTPLSNGTGDEARAVAVDAAGNAYVTGQTKEENFPVRRALQARCSLDRSGECADAFLAKVD